MTAPKGIVTTSGWHSSSMASSSPRLAAAQARRTTSKSSSGMGSPLTAHHHTYPIDVRNPRAISPCAARQTTTAGDSEVRTT